MRLASLSLILACFVTPAFAASMTDAQYMAAMEAMHHDDAPNASPVTVPAPAQPVSGTEVVYATVGGKQVKGYLVRPTAAKGALPGKVGGAFTSTATQHGGQETTIITTHTTLLHQGMVIVGVPYTCPELMNMKEITGGTPYGATTLSDTNGSRQPSENELKIARFQGKHVAGIAAKLKG